MSALMSFFVMEKVPTIAKFVPARQPPFLVACDFFEGVFGKSNTLKSEVGGVGEGTLLGFFFPFAFLRSLQTCICFTADGSNSWEVVTGCCAINGEVG